MSTNQESGFINLTLSEAIFSYKQGYINASALVFFAINIYRHGNPTFKIDNVHEFCRMIGISKRTFYKCKNRLIATGFIEPGICVREINQNPSENQVRDSLIFSEVSGQFMTEVACPAGRIDLLTDNEIIEIKKISDWKSALGQILVYSAYYPEHQKRIHLFGSEADKEKLLDIELSCSAFDVSITFEVVGGAE